MNQSEILVQVVKICKKTKISLKQSQNTQNNFMRQGKPDAGGGQ